MKHEINFLTPTPITPRLTGNMAPSLKGLLNLNTQRISDSYVPQNNTHT